MRGPGADGLYRPRWARERKACEADSIVSSLFLFDTSVNSNCPRMRKHSIKYCSTQSA